MQKGIEMYEIIKTKVFNEDLQHIWNKFFQREKLKGSNILITGCAGFLGFYFCQFLSFFKEDLGIKSIKGLDNFIMGEPKWLIDLQKGSTKKIQFLKFDICKDSLQTIPEIENVDYVIHAAAIASPLFYRRHPIETAESAIWGLRKILEYFKNRRVKGILFFSSSEIYGDPDQDNIPTSEEYRGNVSTIGPRACYDESKRMGETLCYLYARQYDMPLVIARPFNDYGPGMKLDDARVPADFAKAIVENKDLTIFSDGTPTRTFCYVSDSIAGYLQGLTYGEFDYFNFGIEKPEISIRELAEIFLEHGQAIFGYSGRINYCIHDDRDYLTHNPKRRAPISRKASEKLDYSPSIMVDEGVQRFLEFLKAGEVVV